MIAQKPSIAPDGNNPPPPPDPPVPNTETDSLGKEAIAAERALPQTLSDITKRGEEGISRLESDAKDLIMHPPEFKPPPAPESMQPQDPIKVWSSSAMIVAALGSLFTRTPLTTAMNAAAGVIKAYRQGDQDKMNYEFSKWKIADENYRAAFNYQMDYYKALLGDISHREDLIAKMTQEQKADAMATVQAAASAFNDEVMIKQRTFEDQIQLMNARDLHQERYNKATQDSIKLHELQQVVADPSFAKKSPEERMAIVMGHLAGTQAGDAKRQQMVLKYQEGTVEGKAYSQAETAIGDIRGASTNENEVFNNPAAQIALIDRYLYLETGSSRPGLAQYQKLLGVKTGQDFADVISGLVPYHRILGRDQIRKIISTAEAEYVSRKRNYIQMLMRPANKPMAQALDLLPPQRDIEILQRSPTPQNIKYFDQTYAAFGERIAEDILGR